MSVTLIIFIAIIAAFILSDRHEYEREDLDK